MREEEKEGGGGGRGAIKLTVVSTLKKYSIVAEAEHRWLQMYNTCSATMLMEIPELNTCNYTTCSTARSLASLKMWYIHNVHVHVCCLHTCKLSAKKQ